MKKIDLKLFSVLMLLAFVIYFAQTRDFGLMFDGLTYSTLAKNILRTGDWKVLHYDLRQYPDAYYHPPLAMWIQALIYKYFGSAEPISRIFPATCALLTTGILFLFTRARFGITAAFWATIALITSTRFIKWGTNFYLDGIAGFFNFTGFIIWMWMITKTSKNNKTDPLIAGFAGVFLGLGFMTKGVVAFPILVAVLVSTLLFLSLRNLILMCVFTIGALLPILAWIQLGDGLHYLEMYFKTSAFGRSSELNFRPWQNIRNIWIPWWPIFAISIFTAFRKFIKREMIIPSLCAAALAMPSALTFSANYFEHYITPFFPFASLLVGIQISNWIRKDYVEKYLKFTFGAAVVLAVLLATIAPNVNKQKDIPSMLWIREINTLPKEKLITIRKIVFTEKSAEIWLNLATILAKTNWQAIGLFGVNEKAEANTILVTKAGEIPDSSWKKIPYLYVEGNDFYSSENNF